VLCVTLRGKLIGHHAALAVGTAFVAITMFSGHYTSASFNPARTLGTALPCGNLRETWVFVAGPFLGAAIATVTIHIFRWHRTPEEKAQRKKHKLKRKEAVTV
jgi:glycerol uptake facilitator-like aquaporin